jgi:hypothetical protein
LRRQRIFVGFFRIEFQPAWALEGKPVPHRGGEPSRQARMGNEHSVDRDVPEDMTVELWLSAGMDNPRGTTNRPDPPPLGGGPGSARGVPISRGQGNSKAPEHDLTAVLPGCCIIKGAGMNAGVLRNRPLPIPESPKKDPVVPVQAVKVYMEANDNHAKDGQEAEALLTTHLWNAPRDHVRVPLGGRSTPQNVRPSRSNSLTLRVMVPYAELTAVARARQLRFCGVGLRHLISAVIRSIFARNPQATPCSSSPLTERCPTPEQDASAHV